MAAELMDPAVIVGGLLGVATILVVTKEWRAPLESRYFRSPGFWPWSEHAWLGVKAGDAVGALWFLTAALLIAAPGRLGDVAAALLLAETGLLVTLFLFGEPRLLMPHALRGEFRGVVRRGA